MLYNDFLKEIDMKSTEVTLLAGVNAFAFAITGIFAIHIIYWSGGNCLCVT